VSYNETYIRALPRDPEWVYIYWETQSGSVDALRNQMGHENYSSSKRILRLLDITDIDYNGSNAWSHYDTEINQFANNWYLRIPEPGRSYVLELGHLAANGGFYLIIRSNVFSAPRGGISEQTDETWKTVGAVEPARSSGKEVKTVTGTNERNVVPVAAAEKVSPEGETSPRKAPFPGVETSPRKAPSPGAEPTPRDVPSSGTEPTLQDAQAPGAVTMPRAMPFPGMPSSPGVWSPGVSSPGAGFKAH
jgi:hypothetical protein